MDVKEEVKEVVQEVVQEVKQEVEKLADWLSAEDLKVWMDVRREAELLEAKYEAAKSKLEHSMLKVKVIESQIQMRYKLNPQDKIDPANGLISRL